MGGRIDAPVRVTTRTIDSATAGCGYLGVIVPASPDAPRMVEGVYRGRGDTTNIRLSDAEVRRIRDSRRPGDSDLDRADLVVASTRLLRLRSERQLKRQTLGRSSLESCRQGFEIGRFPRRHAGAAVLRQPFPWTRRLLGTQGAAHRVAGRLRSIGRGRVVGGSRRGAALPVARVHDSFP